MFQALRNITMRQSLLHKKKGQHFCRPFYYKIAIILILAAQKAEQELEHIHKI